MPELADLAEHIGEIKFSRRAFLTGAAWTIAGAALIPRGFELAGGLLQALGTAAQERILQSNFEGAGLGDYFNFYKIIKTMEAVYGVTPVYDEGGSSGAPDDPYLLLKRFVSRGMGDDIKKKLINSWGDRADEVYGKAEQFADKVVIEIDQNLPDKEEQIRARFKTLARVFPWHAMTAPHKLRIVAYAGYHDINRYRPTEMAIQSPMLDLEGFFRTGYHEILHGDSRVLSLEDFFRITVYIPRHKMVAFLTAHARGVADIFQTYFSLPWEQALKYRENLPLPLDETPNFDELLAQEKHLFTFGVDVREYPLTPEQSSNRYLRDSRILYAIMRRRFEILNKDPKTLKLREKEFLDVAKSTNPLDKIVQTTPQRAMSTLQHYFVGPVQRDGGGLPGKKYKVSHPSDHITRVNMAIQLARLRHFSTLNEKETTDFDTAAQALRDHFGLDKDAQTPKK